MGLFIYSI